MLVCLAFLAMSQADFDAKRLERVPLVGGLTDAMGMDALADGTVILIERPGGVLLVSPNGQGRRVGRVKAAVFGEVGLMGVAFDPDFARTNAFYVFYSPEEKKSVMRLSRMVIRDGHIDPALEKMIIEVPIDQDGAIHLGGGIARDAKGRILIGVGDNSPPIPELPIDKRPGKFMADALRSAQLAASPSGVPVENPGMPVKRTPCSITWKRAPSGCACVAAPRRSGGRGERPCASIVWPPPSAPWQAAQFCLKSASPRAVRMESFAWPDSDST